MFLNVLIINNKKMVLRREKTLIIMTILTIGIIFLATENVYARGNGQGNGQGDGQGRGVINGSQQQLRDGSGSGQNVAQNMVDSNNNGIADGQEDFDGDGILNRDDEDYERNYVNMKDYDGDGIPNKNDEDYKRPLNGSGRPEVVGRGNVNRSETVGSGQNLQQRINSDGSRSQQNRVRMNNTGIGQQVREILQQEDQVQEDLIQDVEQIRQTSGFRQFFFGANRDVVNSAEIKLEQREQKVEDLKSMLSEIDDPELQNTLGKQIAQMEEVTDTLQQEVRKGQGGILNWFANLFN